MKIQSLAVKNFKIHRERRVEFDDRLTLVAGANETGKSTLLEALTAALFLRSRGKRGGQEAVRSAVHHGHPEVEVVFTAGGLTYTLDKRFIPNSGTSRLVEHGGRTWKDDEVDDRLASILKVEAAKKLDSQWAHLLIKQGSSGTNPVAIAENQSGHLVRRLQAEGGAAVLLSARDQEVATHFERLFEENFKQNGEPKAGSPLGLAIAAEQAARAKLQEACERHAKLLQAAQDFAETSALIGAKTADLEALRRELAETDPKLAEAQMLENSIRVLALEAANAAAEHERIDNADKQIADACAALDPLEKGLVPLRNDLGSAEQSLHSATWALAAADAACDAAASRETLVALRHELARADLAVFEKTKAAEDLGKLVAGIADRRTRVAEIEQKLRGSPNITEDALEQLKELESAANAAKAKLEATAARLRVLAADLPVVCGGQPLAAGAAITLLAETEIVIGEGTRLSLAPGGEGSLQKAKDKGEQTAAALRDVLLRHGVAGVKEAGKAAAERALLAAQLTDGQKALEDQDADRVERDFKEAETELAQARLKVEGLKRQDPDFAKAPSIADAKQAAAEAEAELAVAKAAKEQAEAARHGARRRVEKERSSRDKCREKIAAADEEAAGKRAKRDVLISQHGDDAARAAALAAALAAKQRTAQAHQQAHAALEALQIDGLRRSVARLKKSIDEAEATRNDAATRQAVAKAALQRDASSDPEADLKRAEALHDTVSKSLQLTRRTAEARKLLHELFLEEKSRLAREYTRPLVDRMRGYLGCIFGPQATADVKLDGDKIAGINFARPDFGSVAFDFGQLSGGTAEQVAAAARLAMAEILAADHDGQLPVVFDDAFTNTDPERTRRLLDMLYLAADRGLQIIILSCNPAHYTGIGAREIHLPAPRLQPAAAQPAGDGPHDQADLEPQAATVYPARPVDAEQKEQFLAALQDAGGKSGNIKLRSSLGWSEADYDTVKSALVHEGTIELGQGRGGSVRLL